MSYDLLVDQCATEPDLLLDDDDTCGSSFLANRSDTYNKYIGNDNDTATQASSGYAESTISDTPSLLLDKDSSFALNSSGDIVTIPSMAHLALNARYTYCVDGNPCFPTKFSREHFLPEEPENLSTEMESGDPPAPILTRSEREREDALRMCNMTVSRRGPQKQHRCLWQLAKFMVRPITQVQDLDEGWSRDAIRGNRAHWTVRVRDLSLSTQTPPDAGGSSCGIWQGGHSRSRLFACSSSRGISNLWWYSARFSLPLPLAVTSW